MNSKHIRTRFLINPNFQIRFIVATLILLVFSIVSVYVTLQYYFCELIDIGVERNLNHDHVYYSIVANQHVYFTNFVLLIGSVLFIGTLVWGLYFSHRIAGPIFKLNQFFQAANKTPGIKVPPLNFRKNDFFHEVTESINQYLDQNHLLDKTQAKD